MPTVVFFLARMGMVTAGFLVANTKYAVLIIFIVAAVISPGTDVVSQAMMAGPMLGLYALSILIAWIFAPRKTSIRAIRPLRNRISSATSSICPSVYEVDGSACRRVR